MSEKKKEGEKALHATILNNTLAIRTIKPGPEHDLVVLKPGANVVSPEVAGLIKAHPSIKIELEKGNMEIVGEHEAGGEVKILKDLKPKEAIDIVKKTTDVALLEGWKVEEKRKAVADAIDEQLAELSKPTEFRKPANA